MALRQYLPWRCTGFSRCGWRVWGMNDSCSYGQAGSRRSTRRSFLFSSKLTCSEVQCTDNLLPTCCVCHGTQSCWDPRRRAQGRAILLRPGATSGHDISLLICPSRRWLAGNKQGVAACAAQQPRSAQFHNLVFVPGSATIGKARSPGKRDPGGKGRKCGVPRAQEPRLGLQTPPVSATLLRLLYRLAAGWQQGARAIGGLEPGPPAASVSSTTVLLEAGFSPVSRDASMLHADDAVLLGGYPQQEAET
ncbi:hypothetical protein M441DRAFT_42663 [Trichoderma asperellum CBS 433.97]|uniref:Uncharacterized protein n=1 Tax=Trichoderma asperellum (strain ATCC 204424 / CBS 433.97 / NBRC 101777) TaxID=1042311 RepID=A0A2T3ZQ33_TRIA4|nr:hypothetical protein M441DRAFT_42663 [Trichoderma asperellum CBS 433.97]PTB46922.1 hypothetical protein M441DRAFT_42663 [Trichoderma asperellum CBS 433.97]